RRCLLAPRPYGPAGEYMEQALALYWETGDRLGEALSFNGLGEAARTTGHPTDVITYHAAALAIAVEVTARTRRPAKAGLATAPRALDNPTSPREHYTRGLGLHTDLGPPTPTTYTATLPPSRHGRRRRRRAAGSVDIRTRETSATALPMPMSARAMARN